MMRFLMKGLLRDRSRSLFPVITVTSGVMLTVLMICWMKGVGNDMLYSAAVFQNGHVLIETRAAIDEHDHMSPELALSGSDKIIAGLHQKWPEMMWLERIPFGGLIDVPDENGETRDQGPASGLAVDLLSADSREIDLFNLNTSLVRGHLPQNTRQALLSDTFAVKLNAGPGTKITLIGMDSFGSMVMRNFTVSGTVRFGIAGLDRGAVLIDIQAAREVFDMPNSSGQIIGLFRDLIYRNGQAVEMATIFNTTYPAGSNEFTPKMLALTDQSGYDTIIQLFNSMAYIINAIFVFVLSVILWNAGLLGNIRRFSEIGLRLALGENKWHLYRSLITESLMIGVAGAMIGAAIGLGFAWYLQVYGIDISGQMKNSTMMMPNIMRAQVDFSAVLIGVIPGILATVFGSGLSGLSIFRRQTAQLFKELEV